jgi:hypothetical protein
MWSTHKTGLAPQRVAVVQNNGRVGLERIRSFRRDPYGGYDSTTGRSPGVGGDGAMTDRLPSDHPVVDSHRVELDPVGSTGRPQLVLPAKLSCDPGDSVRLSVGGIQTHAEVISTLRGDSAIRGAYANRRLARRENGRNLLADWFDEGGHGPGSTLVLDVLTEGYAYGLREPGERVVYEPVEQPDASLADIAESLDE